MSSAVGKGILLMFGLMLIGVMTYLFLSNSMVTLPFIQQLADSMNSTPHDIALFFAIIIIFVVPMILIPFMIILTRT